MHDVIRWGAAIVTVTCWGIGVYCFRKWLDKLDGEEGGDERDQDSCAKGRKGQ